MNPVIIPGCSSYYNRKWSEVFYPEDLPSKEWFAYYCTHFNTFELNTTFYKIPTVKSLLLWYHKSPEGFLFAVKAPKLITHINKLVECELLLKEFYKTVADGLAEKLGCVLFQFPPGFHYEPERLELVLNNLDPSFKNVVEFRHESWWRPEVFDAFLKNRIIFCNVNYPKLPTTIVQTHTTGYLRMHGNPKLFYSEYGSEELNTLYEEIKSLSMAKEFFIYFNNTASTAGIINALQMLRKSSPTSNRSII